MKHLILLLFFLYSINSFSQIKCDTLVNKSEFLRLEYLTQDCDESISNYKKEISELEKKLQLYQKRILVLEEILINRERFQIKKCPKFKSRKKPKFRKTV